MKVYNVMILYLVVKFLLHVECSSEFTVYYIINTLLRVNCKFIVQFIIKGSGLLQLNENYILCGLASGLLRVCMMQLT